MKPQKIFLSHATEDGHVVPLLTELLKHHGHEPWQAPADSPEDAHFTTSLQSEIGLSDRMIVVVSGYTPASKWVAGEIAAFRRVRPGAQIVPLVLEPVDLDEIAPGLAAQPPIDCTDCLLSGFKQLFQTLGNEFLPREAAVAAPRRRGADRRRAPVGQRVEMGLLVNYTGRTGSTAEEAPRLTVADADLLTDIVRAELGRYEYADTRTGAPVDRARVLRDVRAHIGKLLATDRPGDTVDVLREIAGYLCRRYKVGMVERRRPAEQRPAELTLSLPEPPGHH